MLLVLAVSAASGCDNAGPGEKTERNIDNAMKELRKNIKEVSEEIEDDAEGSDARADGASLT
ncbi:hypothetical protein [Halomonas sp. E19]|uniref:hypothetical protein n=1 Tax=Halomonas sp. E19 TaxID=3397247 RepID=UPI004034A1E7